MFTDKTPMYELVTKFQLDFPQLVKQMKESNHHFSEDNLNPYHLEGDIWTHTAMVCLMAKDSPSLAVKLSALLHDLGKPSMRRENTEKGRTYFTQHEPVSAFMALDIMDVWNIDEATQKEVFKAIALHTEPFKLNDEQLAKICLRDPMLRYNLTELSYFDKNGRFHNTEAVNDRKFIHGLSFVMPKEKEKKVTVLCGLPCSGKSTYRDQQDAFVVSRDDIIMELGEHDTYTENYNTVDMGKVGTMLQNRFKESLEHSNVIVDMTHMSKKSRRKTLAHYGDDFNKECKLFLTTDIETVIRNIDRSAEGKHIPKQVFRNMMSSFYMPTYSEDFDWIDIIFT